MDLKLNVSKKGLSTTEEVINEGYTLRYGHIFRGERGKSAYESAVDGGYKGTEEEFNALFKDLKNNKITPSGDPMHYAYEAAGARWNANTGYWELNGLRDISSDEISFIYAERLASWTCAMEGLYAYSAQRTNFVGRTVSTSWGYLPNNSVWMFLEARNMEVVRISEEGKSLEIMNAAGMFFRANTLRSILGVIDFASASEVSEMFKDCFALEFVQCANLKSNISFSHSSLLSKESLLFMINNCAPNVTFTITLHPNVWTKCQEGGEWHSEIKNALTNAVNKGTTITLASA